MPPGLGGDDAGRTRLMRFFADRRPSNPVVLTGDIHSNWVNDLRVDFRNPTSPTVATEFVGTSISSGGDGSESAARAATLMAENPFVKYYNAQRGYVSCAVTSRRLEAAYRLLPFVSRPDAPIATARYRRPSCME